MPAGTVMCIIAATGQMSPRLTRPGTETAVGLLLASIDQNDKTGSAGHGLILGGVVFENLTPDFGDAAWATMKSEMSGNFHWLTYADDRLV